MECQAAMPFVSALHDGEIIPEAAAEHIRDCLGCKTRLQEYSQMGAELRLLASASQEDSPMPFPALPDQRGRWIRTLTARVLVPRFALALGVLLIAGLSTGLGLMRAQSRGLWFQFDVSDPEMQSSWGSLLQAGDPAIAGFSTKQSNDAKEFVEKIVCQVRATDVQEDAVRLEVKVRSLPPNMPVEPASPSAEEFFTNVPTRVYLYVPGKPLEIPVEGDGKIVLRGRVFKLKPSFSAEWYRMTPEPDEIALSKGAMVRGSEFLGEIGGAGSARAGNSAFGVCVPPLGAFVFALKPFEGAIQGVTEFGQVRFKMDGQDYILFSATPITGGPQPREIWVYRDPDCPRSWPPASQPLFVGTGDVSDVLEFLRE